jgi:hypothetical protein
MATIMPELRQAVVEPSNLRGLNQAMFIADCLCKGVNENQIVSLFHDDKQLVDMWISFLKHNHWVEYNLLKHNWALTAKGQEKVTGILIA